MSYPTSPAAIRAAILSTLQAALADDYKRIDHHGVSLNAAELKRISTRAPALLLATNGFPDISTTGRRDIKVTTRYTAFILTSDNQAEDRAAQAEDRAFNLAANILRRQKWNIDGGESIDPDTITSTNLTNRETDQAGIAVWSVTWQQTNLIAGA